MNKTIAFLAIAVGAVLVALFLLGRPSGGLADTPTVGAEASVLAAAEQSFDFGPISMAKGKVQHRFAVKNTGAGPTTIARMYTSCMCTTASIVKGDERLGPFGMQGHGFIPRMNMTLASGEAAEVIVTFDPAAHGPAGVGTIARTVYLEQDGSGALELNISATVTP